MWSRPWNVNVKGRGGEYTLNFEFQYSLDTYVNKMHFLAIEKNPSVYHLETIHFLDHFVYLREQWPRCKIISGLKWLVRALLAPTGQFWWLIFGRHSF